ncbi:hypothetical protein PORY_001959 [Pneumocystis oryctolagi]|uniref:Uncharacterized protein n=1 Tax=Pneumocystis oryctolagi TaxID=42067 RepID=A0ACB7CAE7_9ASCO|nr:hypothetical protein PORY_001959 [Pneumocystis oryctolagi]
MYKYPLKHFSELSIKYIQLIKNRHRRFSIKTLAPEGTVLKGINIYKKNSDPIALKESEYPDWLWKILDNNSNILDEEAAKKKEYKKDNKEKIKTNNFLKNQH